MKKGHSTQDGNNVFLLLPVRGRVGREACKIPGKEAEVLGLPGNHQ